ncbi:RsmE family RNA methyltransferase [Veillonella ratti]|uniref:RsmE family RNA methyltransferase n=1 Tax=Veillonella ratti TaxID=103892 RepID=UPI000F8ED651|nr:RsmE family RNA methyltransferase [Veillonella ratti]
MKKIFIDAPLDTMITIPKDTTHHLLTVFRHKMEKPVMIGGSDGKTAVYKLLEVVDGEAKAELIGHIQDEVAGEVEVVLVQGFLKADKLEWVLQKTTELNVHTVYAVPMRNCVVQYKMDKLPQKVQRWEKIMKEAAQQCGRSKLPEFTADITLADVLAREQANGSLLLVAYENEHSLTLKAALEQVESEDVIQRVVIFIGPEGGLSNDELTQFEAAGARVVTLGNTILRAETAAVGAVSMLQYALNMD